MPKKILNLEDKIFTVAWNLFIKKGYDEVDMKGIAKGCNIAVGTLYNYYENKRVLFAKVLEKSWNSTFTKLEEAKGTGMDSIIEILYMDIKNRKGIGTNIFSGSLLSGEKGSIENDILEGIHAFIENELHEDFSKDGNRIKKITHILLTNIVLLTSLYEEDHEENIRLLVGFVSEYLK